MFPLSSNTGKLNLNVNRLDADTIRADTYLNLPTGPLGEARKLVDANELDVADADTGDLVFFNSANLNMSGGNITGVNSLSSGSSLDMYSSNAGIRIFQGVLLGTNYSGIRSISNNNRFGIFGADNEGRFTFGQTGMTFNGNGDGTVSNPNTEFYFDISRGGDPDFEIATNSVHIHNSNLIMNGNAIKSLANPVDISDAVNKFYVDNQYGSAIINADGSITNENGGIGISLIDSTTTGVKIITFDENINQSRISVTTHELGFVVLHKVSTSSIDVYTYNPAGTLTNLQFNYIVYPV